VVEDFCAGTAEFDDGGVDVASLDGRALVGDEAGVSVERASFAFDLATAFEPVDFAERLAAASFVVAPALAFTEGSVVAPPFPTPGASKPPSSSFSCLTRGGLVAPSRTEPSTPQVGRAGPVASNPEKRACARS
jgi:hypothetical protein